MEQLLQIAQLLMQSPSREIIKSLLGFIKVCLFTLTTDVVARHLPSVLGHMMALPPDTLRHFRTKVRGILERLIRKFGCVLAPTPPRPVAVEA